MPPPIGTAARPTTPQPVPISGKKFSQHAQNTQKSAFFHQQGEFCHGPTYASPLQTTTPTAQALRGAPRDNNAGGTLAT